MQALGDLYLLTCFAAVMQGQAIEGEKACSQAIGLDAGNMDAFELRGYAYLLQQRFERAAADFQVVLRSRPKDPDGLAGYGRALSGLGEFDAAVKEFSAAVAAAPKDVPIRAGLCWARGGTGKNLARALADCNTAVKLDPRSASALNSRGMVELRMARFAEATPITRWRWRSLPNSPQPISAAGWHICGWGRLRRAAPILWMHANPIPRLTGCL